MSDNPEDYELVHYGVKGMKWGKSKARAAGESIKKTSKRAVESYKSLTPEDKQQIKTSVKLTATAAVVAGASIVSATLAKRGTVPESSLDPYAAGKIDKYLNSHYMDDQIEFDLLNNYSQQVRRGDY